MSRVIVASLALALGVAGLGVTASAADPEPVAPVASAFAATPAPVVSGTAQVGKKLTATPGAWNPAPDATTYQWLRDGKAISGATKPAYTLTGSDKDKKISVRVTGSKSGFTTVTKTSSKTGAVKTGKLSATPTPKISGIAEVGKKLTAKPGTWKPAEVKFTYQWLRNGKKIKGATKSTYKLTKSDKGKKISVSVKGSKSGFKSVTKTSASTKAVKAKGASLTATQRRAVDLAESYLSYSSFSREGLIDQLKFEGYSTKNATAAVDYLAVDWNKQAVKMAKNYLKYSSFSYLGLIDQLEYEGFTAEQAVYGVDRAGTDWNQQAVKMAKSYLKYSDFSRAGLIDQLEYEGFTAKQAVYGVDRSGADWNQQAVKTAKNYLKLFDYSWSDLVGQLEYEGFTRGQAEYGANKALG